MTELELIATTTFGLEAIVRDEVKDLGYTIIDVKNGRVTFKGDEEAIVRTNLWLRSAERVLLKLGEFTTTDFDRLYEETIKLPWADIIPENAEFPVVSKSVQSKLHSVSTCQSIVKKAVVDNMKKRYKTKWFKENGPLYRIQVALYKDKATLTIDTSGEGLHKRGYRDLSTDAPLQETLAAAMIKLSRWDEDRILIDPFCGSGTIPIEAALLAKNVAPGLNREFASEKWPTIADKFWQEGRLEARDLVKNDVEIRLIMGTDINKNIMGIARHHASNAGVDDLIHFQKKDFCDLNTSRKYGYIICNPPYGERLGERDEVDELYKIMGKKLLELDTWSYYILTSYNRLEKVFGKRASKRRKLYNGGIECQYYQYYGPWPVRSKR